VPEDFSAACDAGFLLVGTSDEVAEGLRREIEISGVNYVLTRFAFGNLVRGRAALPPVQLRMSPGRHMPGNLGRLRCIRAKVVDP
jgi:hypothetical protein